MWPAPSCVTSICERGTTTVWPSENGAGWLTCGFSEIVTASEPCDTAAGITRTRLPITTVPVRELITTLAAASPGSTSMFSTTDRKATRRSEEHTYELQSLMRIPYAVFCLKTKKQQT